MPKKLPAAAVGALAAGLTLPFTTAAVEAAPYSPQLEPMAGTAAAGVSSLSHGTVITASRSSGQFVQPLTGTFTYSSEYGPRCSSTPGASTYHLGQDLVAPDGTPFRSIAAGTVVSTQHGTSSRAGHVMVRHNIGGKTYHSRYLHVWNGTSHVQVGDSVRAGQTIGLVGNSGVSSTPHLHLEIWEGAWYSGTALDPQVFLSARGVDMRAAAARVFLPSVCSDSSGSVGTGTAGGSSSSGSSSGRVTAQVNMRSAPSMGNNVARSLAAGTNVDV
ncbi:M23 family metallopeptidase, partial [Nesterenkonia haasae]|uniref:M23 family metallopeptidase n=1 Tax=Nesterenkonia haasae TaxID=2587813 RepID=UPI001390E362